MKRYVIGILLATVFFSPNIKNQPSIKRTNSFSNGTPITSPWPHFRGNGDHTGRSNYSGAKGKIKWFVALEEPQSVITASPVIGMDGTVYINSIRGTLFAIDGETGKQKWSFKTGDDTIASPVIDGKTIYCSGDGWTNGNPFGKLYAIECATGKKIWEYDTTHSISTSPALGPDNTLYTTDNAHTGHSRLHALSSKTGKLKWSVENDDVFFSSPLLKYSLLYAGTSDGKMKAFNRTTGQTVFTFQTNSIIDSSPAICNNGRICFGSKDGKVYQLNARTGKSLWETTLESENQRTSISSSPAINANGMVYIGSGGWPSDYGIFFALNGTTGKVEWQYTLHQEHSAFFSSPAIDREGTVYVGSQNGKFYAFNGNNGDKKWEMNLNRTILSSPAIGANGTIYICAGPLLYAIK